MKQIIDLSMFNKHNANHIIITLRNVLKQINRNQPFAVFENKKKIHLVCKRNPELNVGVLEGLNQKGIIEFSNWHEIGGFWNLDFEPKKINKWIKDELVPMMIVKNKSKPKSLPAGVKWDDKNYTLKLPGRKNKIQLDGSSKYAYIFNIYINSHNQYVFHKEITQKRRDLTASIITSAIRTMEDGKFKKITEVSFENKKHGACKLLISSLKS